jgi:hypothetical protein
VILLAYAHWSKDAAMFAPKVSKPQAKVAESPAGKPALQSSTSVTRSLGDAAVGSPLFLQRTIGNQATLQLMAQRTSRLTDSRGRNEQEVDPADLAARGPALGISSDFGKIQPEVGDGAVSMISPQPRWALSAIPDLTASSGQELTAAHDRAVACVRANQGTGARLSPRYAGRLGAWLGVDPVPVRIHADAFADAAAVRFGANAFTVGRDIFFRNGMFAPETWDGLVRLAHEMVHTSQQRGSGRSAPGQTGALEDQADDWIRHGGAGRTTTFVGPTILREPTYPRRATGTQMISEVERVIALTRDTQSSDETTRLWSQVSSNFGEVTAGSIARRVWSNLFLRHFVEPESRPGVESRFPRYMYSRSFGWIDAQHFFGFIDYAERHYVDTGSRQQTFDRATAQGIKIERDQQRVRDYIIAGQSPDPRLPRGMQIQPPNTPLFRAPQAAYGAAARMAADTYAGVALSGTEGELFGLLNTQQRGKFWTDSANARELSSPPCRHSSRPARSLTTRPK